MNTNKIFLVFALIFTTFASAQVGIGTQNPQGIFNIDGAKDNAASGTPTATQQANDFVVTSAGSVGIGTTAPTKKLQVNGNAIFTPSTGNAGTTGSPNEPVSVEIYGKLPSGTATQVGGIKMGWYNSFGGIEVLRGFAAVGMGLGFNTVSETTGTTAEIMRITSDGKVGIGTTAPTEKLDVAGNVKFSGALMPNNTPGTSGQVLTSAGTASAPTWTTLTAANTPNIYSADGTLAGNRIVTQGANTLSFDGTASTGGSATFNNSSGARLNIAAKGTTPASTGRASLALSTPNSGSLTSFIDDGSVAQIMATGTSLSVGTSTGNSNNLSLRTAGTNAVTISGTNQNVGVGTTAPTTKLEVNGAATNTTSITKTDRAIDFIASNLAGTTASAGAFTLTNLKDGGAYTLAIKGTTSGTCTFTATNIAGTALTVHLPTGHGATTSGKHTLYNFIVIGTDVYVTWMTGL